MTQKSKVNINFLLRAFELYEEGYNFVNVIKMLSLNISDGKLYEKYLRYKFYGVNGLLPKTKNSSYSSTFKSKIVNEYFNEGLSSAQLAVKYDFPSDSTVRNWIKRYTMGKVNKTYSLKPEVYTMEARKTNLEERIKIVNDYLENNSDYKTIAKKYKTYGSAGLEDGPGKGEPQSTMAVEEEKDAEIKALKERNKYLEMENKVLKKYQEIEREMMNQQSNKSQHTKRSKR